MAATAAEADKANEDMAMIAKTAGSTDLEEVVEPESNCALLSGNT